MENILCFDEPNISKDKWKGKHIKQIKGIVGGEERIEIRKNFNGINLLIIVYKKPFKTKSTDWRDKYNDHNNIKMSMNGKLDLTYDDYFDMEEVIREAIEILL